MNTLQPFVYYYFLKKMDCNKHLKVAFIYFAPGDVDRQFISTSASFHLASFAFILINHSDQYNDPLIINAHS